MLQYLLDTDVCIELIKQNECVLEKVETVGAENCFVTEITIAELFYGAAKSNWGSLRMWIRFSSRLTSNPCCLRYDFMARTKHCLKIRDD